MTSAIHTTMHQEHRDWEGEIHFWRDDVCNWQHELARAKEQLKELEAALGTHAETLRRHAASIRLDEQKSDAHEHALVEFERGGAGTELPALVGTHKAEADRQNQQRETHEQLKRHHHRLMANWHLLLQSLTDLAKR